MNFDELTLGELAKAAEACREEKRRLDALSKDQGKLFEAMQSALTERLDQIGVNLINVDGVSISISETDLPQVEDWDALSEFILSNGYLHLLQRRVSSTAFRELLQALGEVPGVAVWTKRGVNMRVAG